MYFSVCKGLSIDSVGVPRDTAFQEIRPGAGFETGDSVKEMSGGLPTVERLGGTLPFSVPELSHSHE